MSLHSSENLPLYESLNVNRGCFICQGGQNVQFDCGIEDPNLVILTETITNSSTGWVAIYIKNGLGQYPSILSSNGLFSDQTTTAMNRYKNSVSVSGSQVTVTNMGTAGREIEWIAYKY